MEYRITPNKNDYGFAQTKEDVKEGVIYDEGANLLREQFTEKLNTKLGIGTGSGVSETEKSLGSGNQSDTEGRETSESARFQSKGQGRNESSERRLEAKEAVDTVQEI
jgi:ribose 5-phosphate isomerase